MAELQDITDDEYYEILIKDDVAATEIEIFAATVKEN